MLYTQKNSIDVTFIGSGYSGEAMNTYRKIVLNEHVLFEKIYFNVRKKSVSFFLKNILPQLLKGGVNTARLIEISEGRRLFINYYEYLELEPLKPGDYFDNAANIAAKIAAVEFAGTSEFPRRRLEFNSGNFRKSVGNLTKELSSQGIDIKNFLGNVGRYINQNVKRCLNHGDLSNSNTFKYEKVIDWDNYGFYPIGYDFGLIISLANDKEELTLEKYLSLEEMLYNKVAHIVSKEKFQISLPYFTSVFIRSRRVRSRKNDENWNILFSVQLISLLKERYKSMAGEG